MMLGFVAVRAFRDRPLGLSCVAAAMWVACSVFPEEAVLPAQNGGSAGEGALPGDGGAQSGIGAQAGEPGTLPLGGAGAGTGGTASGGGEGGEDPGQAGAGGVSTPTCEAPLEVTVETTLDLWMGSAQPSLNHGKENVLYVSSSGSDERRTLFEIILPVAPADAVLLRAEIVLGFESNADASRAARQLGLYLLDPPRAVVEDKATWEQYGAHKNKDTWDISGGDLSELVTRTDIPAGTSSGLVRFDVTEWVSTAETSVHGIVILEQSLPPPAPAALAFTSLESNASVSPAPSLRLSYCQL
ncbi:MAG: hypothetical protein K0R38_3193 [Polyangiaceae bacterium]|nr:hypothetical protein [Polyangiaceae bacterium]